MKKKKYAPTIKGKQWQFLKTDTDRYLTHRALIFKRFAHTNKGIKRDYSQTSWEQRLAEMDAIFLEEEFYVLQETEITAEAISHHINEKCRLQNELFKKESFNQNFRHDKYSTTYLTSVIPKKGVKL